MERDPRAVVMMRCAISNPDRSKKVQEGAASSFHSISLLLSWNQTRGIAAGPGLVTGRRAQPTTGAHPPPSFSAPTPHPNSSLPSHPHTSPSNMASWD